MTKKHLHDFYEGLITVKARTVPRDEITRTEGELFNKIADLCYRHIHYHGARRDEARAEVTAVLDDVGLYYGK